MVTKPDPRPRRGSWRYQRLLPTSATPDDQPVDATDSTASRDSKGILNNVKDPVARVRHPAGSMDARRGPRGGINPPRSERRPSRPTTVAPRTFHPPVTQRHVEAEVINCVGGVGTPPRAAWPRCAGAGRPGSAARRGRRPCPHGAGRRRRRSKPVYPAIAYRLMSCHLSMVASWVTAAMSATSSSLAAPRFWFLDAATSARPPNHQDGN